jgi:hypothetical protein
VELNVRTVELGTGELEPRCDHCRHPLNLHQPDEGLPSRLLATCGDCFRWFALFALDEDGAECLIVELPEGSFMEQVYRTKSKPASS